MIVLFLDVRIFRQGNEKNILHDSLCDLVMTSTLMHSDAYCRSRTYTWITSAPFNEYPAVTLRLSSTRWQSLESEILGILCHSSCLLGTSKSWTLRQRAMTGTVPRFASSRGRDNSVKSHPNDAASVFILLAWLI